jgi:hypothetical protein
MITKARNPRDADLHVTDGRSVKSSPLVAPGWREAKPQIIRHGPTRPCDASAPGLSALESRLLLTP